MSKDKGSKNQKKAPADKSSKTVSAYKSESKSKFAPIEISTLKPESKSGGKPKN